MAASPPRYIDEDAAIRAVVEGTVSETGTPFFRQLVKNLARVLDTAGAWVTEYDKPTTTMRTLAFWFGGDFIPDLSYDVTGTPCEPVVEDTRMVHIPDRIIDIYPTPPPPGFPRGEVSYLGVPLLDTDGRVMGHLAVIDMRPMPEEKRLYPVFELFAARAAAELRRLRVEAESRARQERLSLLIGSAMDAILELDQDLNVAMMNAAAEKLFGCTAASMLGRHVGDLLGEAATLTLHDLAGELEKNRHGERHVWIPSGFTVAPAHGGPFPAEATLSCFEVCGHPGFIMILRNVNERVEAERRIQRLSAQADYLREELAADHGFDEIVGRSKPLLEALRHVAQVAETDATVLLMGETGTGKELFARAIHQKSARRDGPLVKVNCAAMPATLIESEFFGHERGAFTGATQRRQGRFELADGGTILLDEIAEIPLELQGKLLRVLQEGEFEPVGGSRTRRVDARVIAATHRDLEQAVKDGTLPRGPLLSALRVSAQAAAAARARQRRRADRRDSGREAGAADGPPPHAAHRRRHRGAQALPLARQRARAAQRDRARTHHQQGRPAAPAARAAGRGAGGGRGHRRHGLGAPRRAGRSAHRSAPARPRAEEHDPRTRAL